MRHGCRQSQRSEGMKYINDYSFLFQNSSSNTNSMGNMYSLLSEYNNIQSGTYAKVVKQYYAKVEAEKKASTDQTTEKKETKKQTVSEEEKALNQVQADAQTLTDAADALITKGTSSLFREKQLTTKAEDGSETTTKGYDTDAIYKAVKKFADGYNSLLDSMKDTKSDTISNQVSRMENLTAGYKKLLDEVGVEVNAEHRLTVNEDKLKAADTGTLKTLFNGNTSYAYSVATKASMIKFSAESEANSTKMYTSGGTYDKDWSVGSMLDSLF